MASCQLCGEETDSTEKVKIEGATLNVCESCSDMGETVESKSTNQKRRKTSDPRTRKVLVDDYGSRIKKAREEEGISIKELSDELNEKSSLISKLEKQELKPENSLAEKLSDRLGVDLYTNPEVTSYSQDDPDDSKATLGDVADIED